MALEMKGACEKCQTSLDRQGEAYICSYECTFCRECARAMDDTCPNCGGELVRRPRQTVATVVNVGSLESETAPAQCPIAS
jgi:hypothetical protein